MTTGRGITRFEGGVLAEEYKRSRERITDLVAKVRDSADRNVPACPAWSLHDLVAHVTGIAVDLSAGRLPSGDSQPWVDRQVDERRERTTGDVVAEWNEVSGKFEQLIADDPRAMWGLVYDVVVHEFDARNALGDRTGRDVSGVSIAAELGLKLVHGDLRRAGLGAITVDMEGEPIIVGDGDPTLVLRATPFECLRLLGSRRTRAEVEAANFEGDLRAVVPGLFHMDLPMHSLGE